MISSIWLVEQVNFAIDEEGSGYYVVCWLHQSRINSISFVRNAKEKQETLLYELEGINIEEESWFSVLNLCSNTRLRKYLFNLLPGLSYA